MLSRDCNAAVGSLQPDNRLLTRAALCRERRPSQSRDRQGAVGEPTGAPLLL